MIVMVGNNLSGEAKQMADDFPGKIGHLHGPTAGWKNPQNRFPYAIDNGWYSCWANQAEWSEKDFVTILQLAFASRIDPRWVVVPDRVADRDATLKDWKLWAPRIRNTWQFPLAFAVQDGMTAVDVPSNADVIFIGGSTRWKRQTIWKWCGDFPRVHVARINWERWLWECDDAGAESVDGTGWFRGRKARRDGLYRYLHGERPQQRLPFTTADGKID